MDYDKIDYYRCRSICVEGLKALKSGVDKPLDIDVSASDEPKVRAGVKGKGRKRRSTAGSNTEQSRKKVVKESGRKGAAASKAAGSQKTETTETETSEETEVIETTSSNDDCHDENISNGYIDIPDSPGPSLKPSKVKRGPRNRRKSILASGIASSSMGRRKSVSLKRGPLNRRKSIVASGIASSSMGRRKSVGLKKRRSVVVKELLSAAKAVSWRDCPTIANSSKHTQKLISSSNLDAPVKKGGHGRKVK
ncbi:hypothetical protein PR048_015993 [Dryococelus australis]|uniref:Uncharacterized protein n=1 Tax=Dryococelus australis TaxID=614101 RepID=A0ABQ9HJ12_9NEOP|nr:hypothetical protein PR048_015993 [Dryococelus australis]